MYSLLAWKPVLMCYVMFTEVKQPLIHNFKFVYVDLIIILKVVHNKYNNKLIMKLLYSHIDKQPDVSPAPVLSKEPKSKSVIITVIY